LLPSGKLAGEESALVQVQATVTQIDRKTRTISLQDPQGAITEIVAGPEVRNFAQISAGDRVQVDYLIAVAFEVRKPTADEIAAVGKNLDVSARARLGELPAAGAAVANVKIATIESINKSNQTVTLAGVSEKGPVELKAKYPENLSYIKVGDTVVVTSLEALATSVVRVS
jgi:NADH dehydrogenase FAD-containing subunit